MNTTELKKMQNEMTPLKIENECDGSGPHSGTQTRCLPAAVGGNLILCRSCFDYELAWRKERNKHVATPFALPKWDECKIYKEQ